MLTGVTVTGADDSVEPADLIPIAKEFPFAEFGILLGSHFGNPRFPSASWLRRLYEVTTMYASSGLRLSAHLCGKLVVDFLTRRMPFFLLPMFGRMQVNTHGIPHGCDAGCVRENVYRANLRGIEVIFQYDGANTNALLSCIGQHVTDNFTGLQVATLHNLSHGTGVLPDEWPAPLASVHTGYAGGLSPENVSRELEEISKIARSEPFWIDAETHLRSEDNSRFDLDRVTDFLARAAPHVASKGPT